MGPRPEAEGQAQRAKRFATKAIMAAAKNMSFMKTIKVIDVLGCSSIYSRDNIFKLEVAVQSAGESPVVLDFDGIEFASGAFVQALLSFIERSGADCLRLDNLGPELSRMVETIEARKTKPRRQVFLGEVRVQEI